MSFLIGRLNYIIDAGLSSFSLLDSWLVIAVEYLVAV